MAKMQRRNDRGCSDHRENRLGLGLWGNNDEHFAICDLAVILPGVFDQSISGRSGPLWGKMSGPFYAAVYSVMDVFYIEP
jgi:hypothetical protein